MELSPFLPLGQELKIASTTVCGEQVIVQVVATAFGSSCPLCTRPATRVHSQYTRRAADLPCAGQQVRLILRVRKFFCDTPDCPRKIFTERLAPFLAPWARMTSRLSQSIQTIGLATCGKLGARLAARLGIQTSWMTVLDRIIATSASPDPPVYKLGIDDFALRRGHTYGTILIDLDRHQVIDLLPDRQAETAIIWMQQHPTIELVSRDRGGDYAAAARKGAPQAMQVADRFHLLHNLTQAAGEALMRCWAEQRQKRQRRQPLLDSAQDESIPHGPPDGARRFKRSRTQERVYQARQAARAEEYAQMLALRAQGMSFKAIARQMGKGGTTVWSWLTQGSTPTGIHQSERSSQLDVYIPYLLARYREGCHSGLQLWREITAHGYGGSAHMVYGFLATLRTSTQTPVESKTHQPPVCTAREALWLIIRSPTDTDLSPAEQETLTTLRQMFPLVEELSQLVQAFRQMLHQRAGDYLDEWVKQARASHIAEVRRFAMNLKKDQAAVVAGITVQESNGPTEGFVNKLKLIKRAMYGRASFPLLRQRLLHSL